jgi:hypothetical protein
LAFSTLLNGAGTDARNSHHSSRPRAFAAAGVIFSRMNGSRSLSIMTERLCSVTRTIDSAWVAGANSATTPMIVSVFILNSYSVELWWRAGTQRGAHWAEKSATVAPCQTKLLIKIAHSRVSGRRSLPEMHRRQKFRRDLNSTGLMAV